MSLKILISLTTFCNFLIFAQGSWNIGYLKITDLKKSDIGKTYRIDFKSGKSTEKDISIRSYFSTKDSGLLWIDSKKTEFIEERKIHVDAGYYDNQFLSCKECNIPLKIFDMILIEIKENKLVFMADFELEINDKSDKRKYKKEIEVLNSELEGLIYKQ